MFIKMDESFALTAPIPPTPAAELTSLSKFVSHSTPIDQSRIDQSRAFVRVTSHRRANGGRERAPANQSE